METLDSDCELTAAVRSEALLFVLLAPLLPANLEREFLPLIACSDAAPELKKAVTELRPGTTAFGPLSLGAFRRDVSAGFAIELACMCCLALSARSLALWL